MKHKIGLKKFILHVVRRNAAFTLILFLILSVSIWLQGANLNADVIKRSALISAGLFAFMSSWIVFVFWLRSMRGSADHKPETPPR